MSMRKRVENGWSRKCISPLTKRRRRGRLSVSVKKVLSYEEYKVLSDEELFKLIIDNLTVDDFSLGIKFKGKDKAEYLESILYICPVCHKLHKLYTNRKILSSIKVNFY